MGSGIAAVSIHALTRSATKALTAVLSDFLFQSTHSRGVRLTTNRTTDLPQEFQSTHSRGVRPIFILLITYREMFQSTHSRGVRQNSQSKLDVASLFQSTHSRGVRHPDRKHYQQFNAVSIHALTRSATSPTLAVKATFRVSIHALTRSATYISLVVYHRHHGFNPRTHEECDNISRHPL